MSFFKQPNFAPKQQQKMESLAQSWSTEEDEELTARVDALREWRALRSGMRSLSSNAKKTRARTVVTPTRDRTPGTIVASPLSPLSYDEIAAYAAAHAASHLSSPYESPIAAVSVAATPLAIRPAASRLSFGRTNSPRNAVPYYAANSPSEKENREPSPERALLRRLSARWKSCVHQSLALGTREAAVAAFARRRRCSTVLAGWRELARELQQIKLSERECGRQQRRSW